MGLGVTIGVGPMPDADLTSRAAAVVVEQALLFFMQARRELPDEALIPTRIVLDDARFDQLVQRLEAEPEPTDALRELMRARRA